MYSTILALHNLVRWIVVIAGVLALVRAVLGWLGSRPWTSLDRGLRVAFTASLDTQLLLGLALYLFFSPLTEAALRDFGAAMSNAELRFFGLEHTIYMILAVVLAHIGSSRARKAEAADHKHRQIAIWFSLVVILVALGMPWSRPLLPGLG